jgi:hypothetical protein
MFDLPDQSVIAGLEPFQGYWNGLIFGEGTDWYVSQIDELLAYVSRSSDVSIPQSDGEMASGRWAAGRVVTLPFIIFGDGEYTQRRNEWIAAFDAADPFAQRWLAFRDGGDIHMVRGRVVRRRADQTAAAARAHATPAVVEVKLVDPRVYDGDAWLQTEFVPFEATDSGGFELPAELPLDMAAMSGGDLEAVNTGNTYAYPVIRITNQPGSGNLTELVLTNNTTGAVFEIATVVTEGATLVIDMDALIRADQGPHIHIDGSSRYPDWVPPRLPWGLAPGANFITATHVGGDPLLRLDWMQSTL